MFAGTRGRGDNREKLVESLYWRSQRSKIIFGSRIPEVASEWSSEMLATEVMTMGLQLLIITREVGKSVITMSRHRHSQKSQHTMPLLANCLHLHCPLPTFLNKGMNPGFLNAHLRMILDTSSRLYLAQFQHLQRLVICLLRYTTIYIQIKDHEHLHPYCELYHHWSINSIDTGPLFKRLFFAKKNQSYIPFRCKT